MNKYEEFKYEEFKKVLAQDVNDIDLSDKVAKSLHKNNINNVEQLAYASINTFLKIDFRCITSISQIRYALEAMGLDLCRTTKDMKERTRELWEKFRTHTPKRYTQQEFDNLLATPLIDLWLDLGEKDILILNSCNITTLCDLISRNHTNIYWDCKFNDDYISYLNLELKAKYGVRFCPDDLSSDAWIKRLKDNLVEKSPIVSDIPKAHEYDINEIPEKYRKAYKIGVEVMSMKEAKENTENAKKLVKTTNAPVPKQKLRHARLPKKSDADVLKAIKANITSIESLLDSFVAKHKEQLIQMVVEDKKIDSETSVKLIKHIVNANVNVNKPRSAFDRIEYPEM